jgi:hypothetical protein
MKYILNQISFLALIPCAVIAYSFYLLMHDSRWATTLFVGGLASGILGMWVESRGWEMLFQWITGQLPKLAKMTLPKKDE